MNRKKLLSIGLVAVWLVVSACLLASTASVPFHPDESTQIFMSSDFHALFGNPVSLFYDPSNPEDIRQHYRLLDAPVTRWLIGISQQIFAIAPQSTDWNWSSSWLENQTAGAVPSSSSLMSARLMPAILFCFSIVLIYLTGEQLGHSGLGLAAAAFVAFNPILLLHCRRAMAEGPLFFFTCLFLWLSTRKKIQPILLAAAAALAFNSKQSGGILMIAELIILLVEWRRMPVKKQGFIQILAYLGVMAGITFLLNPVFWTNPVQAAAAAVTGRLSFSAQQAALFQASGSALWVSNPIKAGLVMVYQLLIAPLAYFDTLNYAAQLAPAIAAYQKALISTWFSGIVWNLLTLFFILLGFLFLITDNRNRNSSRETINFRITAICILIFLIFAVPIGFQRYYILLFPILALFFGFGVEKCIDLIFSRFHK
jgi:4-amino-4-deoxy-L-arabinose transferase-like glycosyltransferase